MKIYIAGSFTTERDREELKRMIAIVRKKHPHDQIFVPMEHAVAADKKKEDGTWFLPNPAWGQEVFFMDRNALKAADKVYVMYTGHFSSTGTAWEIGYAYALGITTIAYIPDWARANNMSIMVLNSLSGWMDERGNIYDITYTWLNQFNQK